MIISLSYNNREVAERRWQMTVKAPLGGFRKPIVGPTAFGVLTRLQEAHESHPFCEFHQQLRDYFKDHPMPKRPC